MMMTHTHANHFFVHGRSRLRRALEPTIRAEVEAEFAERLAAASLWRRVTLERQMRREVERRIRLLAPKDGRYLA